MNVKHMFVGAATAVALAMSTLVAGAGLVNAAPLVSAPPCATCEPGPAPGIPAMKCWPYGRAGAGNAVSGGGRPSYPPPCPGTF